MRRTVITLTLLTLACDGAKAQKAAPTPRAQPAPKVIPAPNAKQAQRPPPQMQQAQQAPNPQPAPNPQQAQQAPQEKPAPKSYSFFRDEGSWERIALYIGINEYPNARSLKGCVADATAMRDAMEACFDLERYAFLTDKKATKVMIEAALMELHQVALEARQRVKDKKRKPTVLIFFAGHGDRVEDGNEPDAEPDFMDETWVPHEGNLKDGKHDIRDDWIHYWMRRIAVEAGAQVILISDSCHSGSLYRSTDDIEERSLTKNATFKRKGGKEPDASQIVLPPGCLAIGACTSRQSALEKTIQGRRRGIFSTALIAELQDADPETTYGALFRKVAAKMSQRWPSLVQNPVLMAGELEEAPLFGGVKQPNHAPFESRKAPVRIRRGRIHGVTEHSRVAIYESMADLKNRHAVRPRMRVPIKSLGAVSAELDLPGGEDIDDDMVALVEAAGFPKFRVRIEGKLPPAMAKKKEAMSETKQLTFVGVADQHEISLHHDAEASIVRLYGPERADSGAGTPLWQFRYEPKNAAARLESNLLYLARMHSLVTLDHPDPAFAVDLVPSDADGKSVDAKYENGILQLARGSKFVIRIRPKRSVYVSWWWIRSPGAGAVSPTSVSLEFPNPKHGATFKPVGTTGWDPPGGIGPNDETGRWWLKVVATDQFLPVWLLDTAPETGYDNVERVLEEARKSGHQKTRGALGDPFMAAFKDLLHGGPKMRSGDAGVPAHRYWATVTIPFDIVPAAK
ncbi:MAG: caspase family protein [Planctomycetota bacterium]|nr:caspase family protein [Planctomycetota bacterium]